MASTYVNNLRLEEIGSGEQSGTWGDTTNTNLELIGQATAWGTRAIANASTDNITIADGAADADRCLGLKLTGGGQACTVTLLPNTSSKTWFMYNATSFDLTFTCGSGANVIIPAGHTKVIATDGLGSGGVVHDLLTDLNVASNLFVKNAGTGDGSTANIYLQTAETDIAADDVIGKINFQAPNEGTGTDAILVSAAIQAISEGDFSSSSNATSLNFMTGSSEAAATKMTLTSGGNLKLITDTAVLGFGAGNDVTLTHVHDTGLLLNSTMALQFNDASQFINAPSATVLDINATDEIELNATLVDLNGNLDVSGTALVTGVLTTTAATVFNGGFAANDGSTITTNDNSVQLTLKSTDTDAAGGPILDLTRDNDSAAANDVLGLIRFKGDDAGNNETTYAQMIGFIGTATEGSEGGIFKIEVASHDGGMEVGLAIKDGNANGELDVDIASGTSSITTIAGKVGIGGVTAPEEDVHVAGMLMSTSSSSTSSTAGTERAVMDLSSHIARIGHMRGTTGAGSGGISFLVDSTEKMSIDASGNIIIASTGGTLSTATAGTSNFRAGVNAGNSIADVGGNTGNYNVLIGDEAGTAITIGDENVALGYQALAANVSGDRSTAVGYQALTLQNNGTSTYDANNTAIGYQAMVAMTTGTRNVAIGSGALDFEDTGSRSVAIGFSALSSQNADTSNYNVAVGYDAGAAISLGVQNTILGAQAGDLLDEADRNVAIGYQALTADHKGDRTVAIGAFALSGQDFTSVTSTNNVAVGYEAGGGLTTGASNTIIGANSGVYISTADNSTFMGFKAGQGIDGARLTGDNNVAIGKSAGLLLQGAAANNTLVGTESGVAVTTGVQNTFVGALAGDATDDGTNNVAVGFEALSANCASSNVAVGCRAGKAITGASNTVVGLSAGTNVSSGEHNTLIGKEAGTVIEAGDYNVIIGADSDSDHQNAQSRIVLGFGVENPTDNSVRIGSGGNFISNTFTSNATWAHSSDERLKENIQNDTLGLSFIKDLRPVTFTWKRQADVPEELKSDARFEKATGTHHGMIAQEVKSALDTAGVSTFTGWSSDEGDGTQLVSESMFVYPLVKAVQELSTALDAALARIATLEG